MAKNNIRSVALLLAVKNDKILVIAANDYVKNENFYRLIGGGIEFGETGAEALKREVKEEIKTEIINIKYLGLIENIFNFEGKKMHELALVYQADFKDKNIYKEQVMRISDSRHPQKAYWLNKKAVLKEKFYPEGINKFI